MAATKPTDQLASITEPPARPGEVTSGELLQLRGALYRVASCSRTTVKLKRIPKCFVAQEMKRFNAKKH